MARFFVPRESMRALPHGLFESWLRGEDAHHAQTVLRLGPGDELDVCDGDGLEYAGRVAAVSNGSLRLELTAGRRARSEPRLHVTLFQGVPRRPERMEWLIEKCTEVGVSVIVPCDTERTVTRLSGDRAERRLLRWRRLATEAAKQSGRGRVPVIQTPTPLLQALAQWSGDGGVGAGLLLLPWEEAQTPVRQVLESHDRSLRRAAVCIGPEGGFSTREVEAARRLGAVLVALGPRILRTDTAGLVATALLLYTWDEMGATEGRAQEGREP